MASRFVELRLELLRPVRLVVGVVDVDASSLAARCVTPTTRSPSPRHPHQCVVVAHHGRCLGASSRRGSNDEFNVGGLGSASVRLQGARPRAVEIVAVGDGVGGGMALGGRLTSAATTIPARATLC